MHTSFGALGLSRIVIFVAVAAGLVLPARAADTYPSRPITFVVSTTAGASPDIIARVFGKFLSEELRQPVVVENRGGANGEIAVNAVSRAPADGYTFLVTTAATLSTNPSLHPKTGMLAVTGLLPITKLVNLDLVITARPSLGVKTIQELLARAKADPGKLTVATTALGSAAYLTAEMFKDSSKAELLTVPHNGGGNALNGTLGGHTDLLIETVALSYPYIESGKLTPLATTGAKRSAFLPNLPTLKEIGIDNVEVVGWVALVAPKGVPADIVARVHGELSKIAQRDEVKKLLTAMKAEPVVNSPKTFEDEWRQERQMWDNVIKKAGITLE